jgi:hypothetical protein
MSSPEMIISSFSSSTFSPAVSSKKRQKYSDDYRLMNTLDTVYNFIKFISNHCFRNIRSHCFDLCYLHTHTILNRKILLHVSFCNPKKARMKYILICTWFYLFFHRTYSFRRIFFSFVSFIT